MRRAVASMVAVLLLTGCGLSIPSDPKETLEEITGGTLQVGVTESLSDGQAWVRLEPGQEPSGTEPELVRDFAASHDAQIEWVQGSGHQLATELKHGELDLVIGGFASDTPWVTHAGLTKPYVETMDKYGKTVKHVMLVLKGENAFLLELDKFLQEQAVKA